MKQMTSRIVSAVIGLPFAIFLIIIGGNTFNLIILLITLIALFEFYNALKHSDYNPVTYMGCISSVIFFIIITLDVSMIPLYLFLLIITFLIIMLFNNVLRIEDISLTLLGVFYVGMLFGTIVLLRQSNYGALMTFYLMILSWGTDTFAFFTGKLFGKHKLIPQVSPNKTIEGAIGGLIISDLLSVIFIYMVGQRYNILIPSILILFLIGLVGSIFSQMGDLVASAIKRRCNIKDFGNIIPGHGGILDRFDGLIFVSAYLYVVLFIYNRIMFM